MMSDAGARDGDYSSGEGLLSSRTHAKALLAPIVVQALVIVLAYGVGRWIPVAWRSYMSSERSRHEPRRIRRVFP